MTYIIKTNKKVSEYIPEVSVCQVTRDNEEQDNAMVAEIFHYLVDKALNDQRLNLTVYIKKVKILDSTLIRLCLKYFRWAEYRKNVGEIKIHTLFDLENLCPEKVFMTSGKPHGSLLINVMGFEPGHHIFVRQGLRKLQSL